MKAQYYMGLALILGFLMGCSETPASGNPDSLSCETIKHLPRLEVTPHIDGDLSEWKYRAFSDGVWDLARVRQATWYEPDRNRLTDHGDEPGPVEDLQARYYVAWDSTYLYLGAEVRDNVNDVTESRHAPKRWYYKDAIAWFFEAPADTLAESFGEGDHAFAFVIDRSYPAYGAWWRRGSPDSTYLEDPLPSSAVDYVHQIDTLSGDFVLEARVRMAATFGQSDPRWQPPREGDLYRMMIVHCDPDGGEYGGHLLIYGRGDNDSSWHKFRLGGATVWEERRGK